MDENNVFNSFSFKKWAKYVRQQRIEEEILRQRMVQVVRLRNKLIRERALRDQVDLLTDEDVDKLVHYMNTGKSFSGIATGIQSTFRLGRRHDGPSQGQVDGQSQFTPIPNLTTDINEQITEKAIRATQIQDEPEEKPITLSNHLPPEGIKDSNYLFEEVSRLGPLHPNRKSAVDFHRNKKLLGQGLAKKPTFFHNSRFAGENTCQTTKDTKKTNNN